MKQLIKKSLIALTMIGLAACQKSPTQGTITRLKDNPTLKLAKTDPAPRPPDAIPDTVTLELPTDLSFEIQKTGKNEFGLYIKTGHYLRWVVIGPHAIENRDKKGHTKIIRLRDLEIPLMDGSLAKLNGRFFLTDDLEAKDIRGRALMARSTFLRAELTVPESDMAPRLVQTLFLGRASSNCETLPLLSLAAKDQVGRPLEQFQVIMNSDVPSSIQEAFTSKNGAPLIEIVWNTTYPEKIIITAEDDFGLTLETPRLKNR